MTTLFDRRRLLGAGLALVAAVLVIVATRPPSTVAVLVAARPVAAGATLDDEAFETRQVTSADGLVVAGSIEIADHVLRNPLAVGEPLIPSLLARAEAPAPRGVMGVELPAASTVNGDLVPGDRVDVYATDRSTAAEARRIATGLAVVGVAADDAFGGISTYRILIGVDHNDAATISAASHRGDLDLVRTGR